MISSRQDNASLHSDFYRIQYHKMLRRLMVCVILIYFLIAAIIYIIFHQPTPAFYASTTDGKILNMPPARVE